MVLNEELFEQFKFFEILVKKKSAEWHSLTFKGKWMSTSIFISFRDTSTDYSTLLKLVEFAFALPGSNAVL